MMDVKRLNKEEIPQALELAWQVFLQFEAPEYEQAGIDEFHEFLENEDEIGKLELYGAFHQDNNLAGILAMRGQHISLFFVREQYQNQGLGRQLFLAAVNGSGMEKVTVNSSPYAVKIYEKLGFQATDREQITNGIRYTPMER